MRLGARRLVGRGVGSFLRTRGAEFRCATTFLTIVPIGAGGAGASPSVRSVSLAQSAWCFPFIGLGLGLVGSGVGLGVFFLSDSVLLSAVCALGMLAVSTGALHEDGLADSFDALKGGEKARKDPTLGSFGTLALILSVFLRVALLHASGSLFFMTLLVSQIGSRWSLVLGLAFEQKSRGRRLSVLAPAALHAAAAAPWWSDPVGGGEPGAVRPPWRLALGLTLGAVFVGAMLSIGVALSSVSSVSIGARTGSPDFFWGIEGSIGGSIGGFALVSIGGGALLSLWTARRCLRLSQAQGSRVGGDGFGLLEQFSQIIIGFFFLATLRLSGAV